MKKRGQVSFEYLALVGFVTIVVLILLGVSSFYQHEVEKVVNTNQVDQVGRHVVDSAEAVFYYGEPSKTTIRVRIPEGVDNITVGPNELVFGYKLSNQKADLDYYSSVTLGGEINPAPGFRDIVIEAQGGLVWINGT